MRAFKRSQVLAGASMVAGIGAILDVTSPAHAELRFNFTYGSGIAMLSPAEQTQVKDSMNYIAGEYSSDFANNVTLNIGVNYNSSVALAQSSANYEYQDYTYAQIRTALLANTPGDAADLPATDPTLAAPRAGSGGKFSLTTANAKALGLFLNDGGTDSSTSDGEVSFGTGPWTFYPDQNRQAVDDYDFTSSLEHEVSEIMGRQSLMSQDSAYGYGSFDLFRYNGSNSRSFVSTTVAAGSDGSQAPSIAYFSLDNGATNLMSFADTTGDDIHDWYGFNHDSFDAEGPTNDAEPVTPVDLLAMNAIGWSATAVPEPTSIGFLAIGSASLLVRRRRSAK